MTFAADLAICEAAPPGPWLVDENAANQIRQPNGSKRRRVTTPPDADGIRDTLFTATARDGWPHAIRRAMAAEAEVERLRFVIERMDTLKADDAAVSHGALDERIVNVVSNKI